MQKIFRTYAHSKAASFVSVGGVVLSILLVIGAIICLAVCIRTEIAVLLAATLACIALSILSYKFSEWFAERIALSDLEKKLGKLSNKE